MKESVLRASMSHVISAPQLGPECRLQSATEQQSQFYIILEILEILKASKNIRKAIKYTAAEKQLS